MSSAAADAGLFGGGGRVGHNHDGAVVVDGEEGGNSEEVVGIDARGPALFKQCHLLPCVVDARSSSPADPPYQLHHLAGSPASGRGSSPSRRCPRTAADGGDKQHAGLMVASRVVLAPFPLEPTPLFQTSVRELLETQQ
jgi:hypothetical protein